MALMDLPTETLLQILYALTSVPDVLALTLTSRRLYSLLSLPAHRLQILFSAASRSIGPLQPAIFLVTHTTSQPSHLRRPYPPHSLTLLQQLLAVGAVANAWADIFPFMHWRGPHSAYRRFLTPDEREKVRGAVYRTWEYDLAFHNDACLRTQRNIPYSVSARAAFVRQWPSAQLREMASLQRIFRCVLECHVVPSNAVARAQFKERYGGGGDEAQQPEVLLVGGEALYSIRLHHQQQQFGAKHPHCTQYIHSATALAGRWNKAAAAQEVYQGWGDEVTHYYLIEDVLKLHPKQILQLFRRAVGEEEPVLRGFKGGGEQQRYGNGHGNGAVETFLAGMGEWFYNNGETMAETIACVLEDRGEEDVEGGGGGIVGDEDG
ncbi:MAG: hypothetical protein Q9214_007375 [Letrouitia sp. 1 TL-2023]